MTYDRLMEIDSWMALHNFSYVHPFGDGASPYVGIMNNNSCTLVAVVLGMDGVFQWVRERRSSSLKKGLQNNFARN